MIEEPRHPLWQVGRDELMSCAGRQPGPEQLGRGHGSCGHEDLEARSRGQQTLDQPENRGCFTDTGRMNPNQSPAWPRRTGYAPPLAKAGRMFLAAPTASGKIGERRQRERPSRYTVKKGQDQSSTAGCASPAASEVISGGGARCPTRPSASRTISSMRVSIRRRAFSNPFSSRSGEISMGSPHK